MKKLVSVIIALCLSIASVACCIGCNDRDEKPFVDTSNAAECGAFDRPDYAKEMELAHDAEREHIEIPEGAETVEINGEEYIPVDSLLSIDNGDGKNYILTCDQSLTGSSPLGGKFSTFRGKLNGNNYKIKGTVQTAIIHMIEDGEIFNLVLSSDLKYTDSRRPAILVNYALNSKIYNIVNYSNSGSELSGIVLCLINSYIGNCENYADLHNSGIVAEARGTSKIIECKNYGNLSDMGKYVGGIVGYIFDDKLYPTSKEPMRACVIVEKCVNYGNIIGNYNVGGIVGYFYQNGSTYGDKFTPQEPDRYLSQSIIRDCQNYGNIYRDKNKRNYELTPIDITEISCFGGIAGVFPNIENCTNQGNIYGFEAVNPKWQVGYVGGITGAAVSVENCENTGTVDCSDHVRFTDDICGYYIKTNEVIL